MKETNMPKADFVTALVLITFSITVIVLSIGMPRMEEVGADPYSAPGIVPGFLGVIILFLSIILLVRSILNKGHQPEITWDKIIAFFRDEAILRVVLTIILSVIYGAILLGSIPYVLATFLYGLLFVLIFEYHFDKPFHGQEKTVVFSFVQAVLVAGVVAAVFRYVFLVKLP
jgi:hypothetical protein